MGRTGGRPIPPRAIAQDDGSVESIIPPLLLPCIWRFKPAAAVVALAAMEDEGEESDVDKSELDDGEKVPPVGLP